MIDETQQRRDALLQYLTSKNNPELDQARSNMNSNNQIANLGQAMEGMFRARSQAVGGQGANKGFYDALRQQSGQQLEDVATRRREALNKMLMARKVDQEEAAQQAAGEEKEYQRGLDAERLGLQKDRLDLSRNPKMKPTNRYDFKVDGFGRMYKIDKMTGEHTPIDSQDQMQPQGQGQTVDEDMPPQPMPGENRQQYNARMKMWESNQRKKDKPRSTTEYQAMTFANRIEDAEKIFDKLQKQGYDRSSYFSGMESTLIPDALKSGPLKEQEQAERNFINAVLRRESGAAIADTEFSSAEKQYFPRAGDTPEVLANKARNRAIVLDGLKREGKLVDPNAPSTTPQPTQGNNIQQVADSWSDEDRAAIEWALQNKNDPRAKAILESNGIGE